MSMKVLQRQLVLLFCILSLGGLSACQAKAARPLQVGVITFSKGLEPVLTGFKQGLADLGYTEGEKISYIYQGPAGSLAELDTIAAGLVAAKVDLILAISTPSAMAAQRATAGTGIPVVFAPVTDPVSAGLAESLSHPGGNITGVTNQGNDSRRLEWLLKLAPAQIKQIYIVYNPDDLSARSSLQTTQAAAQELGLELVTAEASDGPMMIAALAAPPDGVDAIVMLPDSLAVSHTVEFVSASIAHRLPLSGPTTAQVEAGALVSYGLDIVAAGKQAARLADQIFRGADPAGLPIEEVEFLLAINLKTAKAIGLEIPETILNQANQIFR